MHGHRNLVRKCDVVEEGRDEEERDLNDPDADRNLAWLETDVQQTPPKRATWRVGRKEAGRLNYLLTRLVEQKAGFGAG